MSEERGNADRANESSTSKPFPQGFTAIGNKQIEELIKAQSRLLNEIEEESKYWFQRMQSQANSVAELASKMSTVGSPPDLMKTYQEWGSQQFGLMAEDGKHFLEATQKLIAAGSRLLPNGWISGGPHAST